MNKLHVIILAIYIFSCFFTAGYYYNSYLDQQGNCTYKSNQKLSFFSCEGVALESGILGIIWPVYWLNKITLKATEFNRLP
ncbi:MAG: hypothetical protein GY928_40565 [Colwellia sp.]|nr:hypothetical protein [Colwellia sp.]